MRKEFIELRRDRRTLAMIIAIPVLWLLVFGYAASFDVKHVSVELVGRDSVALRASLARAGNVAQTALRNVEALQSTRAGAPLRLDVLYNPTLRSADFMVPALVGLIMAFIGTVITSRCCCCSPGCS